MTAYTIKPLEWECISQYRWISDTIIGRLVVRAGNRTEWYLGDTDDTHLCDSIDDGKAKAEAYFRERLLAALVPVPDGAAVVDVHYDPNPEGRSNHNPLRPDGQGRLTTAGNSEGI